MSENRVSLKKGVFVFALMATLLTGCKSAELEHTAQAIHADLLFQNNILASVDIQPETVKVTMEAGQKNHFETIVFSRLGPASRGTESYCAWHRKTETNLYPMFTGSVTILVPMDDTVTVRDKVITGKEMYEQIPVAAEIRKTVSNRIALAPL